MNIRKRVTTKAEGRVMTLAELRHVIAMADATELPDDATVHTQIRWGNGVKELVIDGTGE